MRIVAGHGRVALGTILGGHALSPPIGILFPTLTLSIILASPVAGDTVTITGTVGGGGTPPTAFASISVSLGGSPVTLSGSGLSRSFIATAAGTYSIMAAVTNANGTGYASANLVVPTGTLADVTMLSSVPYGANVTYNFDAPVPIVYDALGYPHVVATSGRTITSISPASSVGATWTNGASIDHYHTVDQQGFDSNLVNNASIKDTIEIAANAALNQDPAVAGAISIAAPKTVLKFVPRAALGDAGNALDYGALSVLPAIPPAGFFPPNQSAVDKTPAWREAMVHYDVLRNLTAIGGQMSKATAEGAIPDFRFGAGWGGEQLRSLSNDRGGSSSTYMSTKGPIVTQAYNTLHTAATDAEKRLRLMRMVRIGLDRAAEYQRGWRGAGGAGQFQVELECVYTAAFALKSPELLAIAQDIRQNVTEQIYFVPTEAVGYRPGWPTGGASLSDQRRWNSGFQDIHVDQPFMFQSTKLMDSVSCMKVSQRYVPVSSDATCMGLLYILLLQNGPGGISGLDAWLNARGGNGLKDRTNRQMAAIWWMDRWFAYPNDNDTPAWMRSFYAAARPLIDVPVYSGPGLTFETLSASNDSYLTATAAGFSFNFSGVNWSPGTLKSTEVQFSQDGIQFIPLTGASGTVSVVPGTSTPLTISGHYVQMRYQNTAANGSDYWSEWSPNYSYSDLDDGKGNVLRGERLKVTPTGSRTAHAPVTLVAPKLYVPAVPGSVEPSYLEAPSTLSLANGTLVAGFGYVDAHPAATATYQLEVNGVLIGSPQTSPRFNLDRNMPSSAALRVCRVATNASGSVTDYTNTVTASAIRTYASNIKFSSEFGPSFDREWPEVADTFGVSNSSGTTTLSFQPDAALGVAPPTDREITGTIRQTNPGAAVAVKGGGSPRLFGNLAAKRPLTVGNKYRLEADIYIPSNQTAPRILSLRETAGGADLVIKRIDHLPCPRVERVVFEFTAGATAIWWTDILASTTGGTAGGNLYLSDAILTEVAAFVGEGYPAPHATPIVVYDSDLVGDDLSQWTVAGAASFDGSNYVIGDGTNASNITRIWSGLEVGRQYEITVTARRSSGTGTEQLDIGRPAYTDPDWGSIATSSALYYTNNGAFASTSFTTQVQTIRLQTIEQLRIQVNNRVATDIWQVSRVLIREL